ncbi:MAG: hypothetical protein IPM66_09830 [Acidobacteriota bacterium]|nr:MAG: hypothetical protein IPM66_09830 [Acidobacteriota bacterium]
METRILDTKLSVMFIREKVNSECIPKSLLCSAITHRSESTLATGVEVKSHLKSSTRVFILGLFILCVSILVSCAHSNYSKGVGTKDAQPTVLSKAIESDKELASYTIKSIQNKDEYFVYTAVIDKYISNSKPALIVIDGLTTGLSLVPGLSEDDSLDEIIKETHFNGECLKSFKAQNATTWQLSRVLPIAIEYKITKGQLEQIDSDMKSGRDGWGNYYGRYPNSQGLLSLSRVGFCKNGTEAVVYIANRYSADGGWGRLTLLKKNRSKKWRVVKDIILWVS